MTKYNWIFSIFLIISSFHWSCSSNNNTSDPFANCKYSAPEAVFSDTLKAVISQSFDLQKTTSTEIVQFENGLLLELIQSGCDTREQEYRFKVPPTKDNSPQTTFIAAESALSYLSNLSPIYRSLNDWSRMIAQNRANMKIAQPLELAGGFQITVDKIPGADKDIVIVRMGSSS